MLALIKHEFKIQNKVTNLIKYTSVFLAFYIFSITLVTHQENIRVFGVIFPIISIPLIFVGLTHGIIRNDIEDGSLENYLASMSAHAVVFSKYIALCICTLIGFCFMAPLIFIMYNIETKHFISIIFTGVILITISASLSLLISLVQAYFRSNTSFLSVIIMPLIIPDIILSGLFINSPEEVSLARIMIGVNLVIISPSIYLSSYLLDNIYNI